MPSQRLVGFVVLMGMVLVVAGSQAVTQRASNTLATTRRSYTRFLKEHGAAISPSPDAVLQRGLNDCGPAVLEALLRELPPRSIPARDSLADLAGLTARGTTLEQLAYTLGMLGVKHRRVDRNVPLVTASPFIAHMTYRHFVLVRSVGERRVLLFDPLVGEVMMDTHQFEKLWSGGGIQVLPPATQGTHTNSVEVDMRLRHMIMGLAALHMAAAAIVTPEVVAKPNAISATVISATPSMATPETGGGFKEALTCAGCLTAGTILIASGGGAGIGLTLIVGGSAAVGIGSAVAVCMYACYEALT